METIIEKTVTVEQVTDLIEQAVPVPSVDEVTEKVVEQTAVALDQVQTVVEDTTAKVSESITAAIESNSVVQKVDALIDSNPEVKAAVDKLEAKLVEVVDGKSFTCWCFGWWWTLKINRRDPRKPLSTPSPSTVTAAPVPSAEVKEWSPPTAPVATS